MYSLTPVLFIHLFSREENKHHVFGTVNDSLIITFLIVGENRNLTTDRPSALMLCQTTYS